MIKDVKDIIIAVVASGAFFSFLQFLITRFDNKKNIEKLFSDKIKDVSTDIRDVKTELSKEVKGVSDRLEEHRAVLARTHILRFADELRTGKHSKEYFLQQLQDIKTYDQYCKAHPDFENNLTTMSSEYIQEEYKRIYLSNDTD